MKDVIAKLLEKQTKMKKEEIETLLEIPPTQDLGDFSFPCFKLAAIFKKNPVEIAKNLAKEIKPKAEITKIEAKGPYVNFFIDRTFIAEDTLNKIDEKYGESKIGKGKKVVIDFSSPNIGKPMHVGHIRSTIVGDSMMRIYHYLGYDSVGINFLGDIGLHIGKLIVAWELWLDKKALKEDPIKEMLKLYVKFCEKEKSEIQEGQEEDIEMYADNEWTNKAREKIKLLELGDKKTHNIWQDITKHSGIAFNRIYDLLKVRFNETTGPSKFSDAGKEIIINAQKKGIAKIDKETGAVFMEFEKLPKKYILRSDGTASYMTYDIGAAVERYKKYKFDEMIYVTDFRQNLHFQQLFKILDMFGYDFSKKCKHIGFGTVNFGKEIMATREGKIVLLEDVLKKTIEKAKEEIEKRKAKGEEFDETKKNKNNESGSENASKIGVGAVKYIILRNEPIKDVEFSWEQALNFEGDSGPYLQYSYARANSILKKAKTAKKQKKEIESKITEQELALIKKIGEFPQIVESAEKNLNPAIIASYAFQLSQTFNEFYHACKVVGEKSQDFRLKLIRAFMITLKNALYLLGIEVMDEM